MRVDTHVGLLLPVPRANVVNTALPAAEASLISADLVAISNSFPKTVASTYSTYQVSTFRVYVCISVAGILRVARTLLVGGVMVEDLNGGAALVPSVAYMFEIEVRAGDKINLRYSVTTGTIYTLRVDEVGMRG